MFPLGCSSLNELRLDLFYHHDQQGRKTNYGTVQLQPRASVPCGVGGSFGSPHADPFPPRHRLWWCICLWVCVVNRSGSSCELNITKSPFLATPTEGMNDYIY